MPRSRHRDPNDASRMRLCVAICELEFGVPDITATERTPMRDFVRQVAMRLAHTAFGFNHTQIGEMLRRDRSTVAHGCTVVEDACEDPVFAARLDALEGRIRALPYHRDTPTGSGEGAEP